MLNFLVSMQKVAASRKSQAGTPAFTHNLLIANHETLQHVCMLVLHSHHHFEL